VGALKVQKVSIAVLDRELQPPIVVRLGSPFDWDFAGNAGVERHNVINFDPELT
jgi:hypothetical protein